MSDTISQPGPHTKTTVPLLDTYTKTKVYGEDKA